MVQRLITNINTALSKLRVSDLPVAKLAALVLEPNHQESHDRIALLDTIRKEADEQFFRSAEGHAVLKTLTGHIVARQSPTASTKFQIAT